MVLTPVFPGLSRAGLYSLTCGLYDKHIMIVNDVSRAMLQIVASLKEHNEALSTIRWQYQSQV